MGIETLSRDGGTPVVLVIDDSQDVHRLLKARLKREELEIASAMSGEEGIALAKKGAPSIVLLDLDMPGMDGFETLRRFKEDSDLRGVPVIVLSGLQSPHDKVTAFDLGAVDYVTKPFELTELRVRVRSALRIQQLMTMLAQRAQVDGLTGLWNRAYFDTRWAEEVSRSSRHARPLSVAMVDIDHFKSINDSFGHPAGDSVIQGLAKILQRECRASDVACRYGGEEFAVIMPDTGPDDAKVLCDRVRTALSAVTWPKHPERRVTASIGIAGAAAGAATTPESWLEAADRNLYAVKKGGRNNILATDISTPAYAKAG